MIAGRDFPWKTSCFPDRKIFTQKNMNLNGNFSNILEISRLTFLKFKILQEGSMELCRNNSPLF